MITSLDYGATRNGGLVNSFTHTTLPNSFSTLPHLHNHNHHHHLSPIRQQPQQQVTAQQHVHFGTLPVRGSSGGDKPPPPPYPGSNGIATAITNGNGFGPNAIVQLPRSSQQQQVQTQVIYTAK